MKISYNWLKDFVSIDVSAEELAEKLYLSDSFIAKLESITYQSISIDTLEEIANVLECDIRDFFDRNVDIKK